MRRTLTDKGVAALKPRAKRYAEPDPELRGHVIRVQPSGAKAFYAVTRDPAGKQIWTRVEDCAVMPIAEAREAAREILKRVRAGLPAIEVKPDSVAAVVESWLTRYAEPKKLRTLAEIRRVLNAHILPDWRDREFVSIRRSDVTKLLDKIGDRHGTRAADYALTTFSSVANWYAARTDDYVPPLARGMKRQTLAEQSRDRILGDAEIRAVWRAAESSGMFGAIVRLALLTAQRRTKVAEMRRSDISPDGEWTVPGEGREKGTGGVLRLPEAALTIIRAQIPVAGNPHVFPGTGASGSFQSFGPAKAALDAKLPTDMPNWVLHDCRRTARSLMSRAGVRPDVAELVLGHAIRGVAGIYDRHRYTEEKAAALAALANLIGAILNPAAADNVVPMESGRAGR